jgi:Bacteriophage tail sheath protein
MATSYLTPGVYIHEEATGSRPIQGVGTSTAAFLGEAPLIDAYVNEAVAINNWTEFVTKFGGPEPKATPLALGVSGFFLNGGSRCFVVNVGKKGSIAGTGKSRSGVAVLETVDEVTMVAAPGYSDALAYDALLTHCENMGDRVALLDAPTDVRDTRALLDVAVAARDDSGKGAGARPRVSDRGYGAVYFPGLTVRDPFSPKDLVDTAPSGFIAGICARIDGQRGVHKAPANEIVRGALNLTYRVTDAEQGDLNANGVNIIRLFSREGIRVWGARTLAPGTSEWKYLNVRRLFNYVEESLAIGLRWAVFEPNDEALWKSMRRDITAFLTQLWRSGALFGATPQEAFFVKCDRETNPPDSVDQGKVVCVIGIAPVKPAEFIVIRIGQSVAGVEVEES